MFLAHLVGDYVLQWDALAAWKSRELKGVLVHGLIILATTWLFALPFDSGWWWGVLFISATHVLIDASQLYIWPPMPPLLRFTLDQTLHFAVIFIAVAAGGYISWNHMLADTLATAAELPILTAITLYAFITMPAWVLLKFVVAAGRKQPPDFPAAPSKYLGITERLAIATVVVAGPIFLVPLVALPQWLVEWPKVAGGGAANVYIVETAGSIILAVLVGLGVRFLVL